jgi:DNA-binding transcriptional MocR family regulator
MQCSACGAVGTAACDCGAPYLPPAAIAANAIAADPNKSNRAIAEELGIGSTTVNRARGATAPNGAVEKRVGRDGRARKTPKRAAKKAKPEEVMPTQEEADASHQSDCYDIVCRVVDYEMSGETRQRFFAHLRRKYNENFIQSPAQRSDKGLSA